MALQLIMAVQYCTRIRIVADSKWGISNKDLIGTYYPTMGSRTGRKEVSAVSLGDADVLSGKCRCF